MKMTTNLKRYKRSDFNYNDYKFSFSKSKDALPEDDFYKSNKKIFNMEWWHFESIFDNSYSFYFGLILLRIKNYGFIFSNNKLYSNGNLLLRDHGFFLLSDLKIDNNYQLIKIRDNICIKFDDIFFKKFGKWKYDLLIKDKNFSLDLQFISKAYGYKTKTKNFHNIIMQPKANVKGLLTVHNKKKQVLGVGYHNRILEFSPISFLKNVGFFAGSIFGNSLSITWDRLVIDMNNGYTLMKLLDDNSNKAYDIKSNQITFILNDFKSYKTGQIPSKIIIKSNSTIQKKPLLIDLEIKIEKFHQEKFLTLDYLLFYINVSGKIIFGSQKEVYHNNFSFAEYPLFKSTLKLNQKKVYWN